MTEDILCVPATIVPLDDGYSENQSILAMLVNNDYAYTLKPRDTVEQDETVKQIIPYVIIYHAETDTVLTYRSGKAGAESRLFDMRSIGVGGHINAQDAVIPSKAIFTAAHREVREEIGVEVSAIPEPVALVYDNLTEVGRVHLGVVIVLKLKHQVTQATCPSLADMHYVRVDELKFDSDVYERWSRFCIARLRRLVTFKSIEEVVADNTIGATERRSVLHDWVGNISLMQQTVLLTAIRGPDGLRKFHPAKMLCRWLRRSILVSAFDRKPILNPEEEGGGSFSGPCHDENYNNLGHALHEYFRAIDEVPLHFHLHLMHASEILGYKHPVASIRDFWRSLYFKMAQDLHLTPETEAQLDKRLGDREEDWRAEETVT